jgi:hypothetical protein
MVKIFVQETKLIDISPYISDEDIELIKITEQIP